MGISRAHWPSACAAIALLSALSPLPLDHRAQAAGQNGWRAPDHAGSVVMRSDEMVVTITDRGQSNPTGASNVRLIVEADTRASGFASLSSLIDVDCTSDRVLLKQAKRFSVPNLAGKSEPMISKPTWLRPAPDAYLGLVAQFLCGRKGLTIAQASAAERSHSQSPITTALAALQTPAPLPPPTPAGEKLALGAQGSISVPTRTGSSSTGAGRSGPSVQILASTDPAEARLVLDKVVKTQAGRMGGLSARVATATINGALYHRARISGFSSSASAQQFCAALKTTGQACFVAPP